MDPLNEDPAGPKRLLLGHLATLGVSFVDHQTPRFLTMEDCRQERSQEIQGVFCKNLFIRDKKKQFFLITVAEDTEVDLNSAKLRKDLGASRCLTFTTSEEVQGRLGVAKGGVTPLAAFNFKGATDIKVVLDQKILEADLANFHPLDLESTLTLSPQDLLRFLTSVSVEPIVLDFGPSASPVIPTSSLASSSSSSSSSSVSASTQSCASLVSLSSSSSPCSVSELKE